MFSQWGLPLLFCVLASPPVHLNNNKLTVYHYNLIFYVILFVIILASYIILYQRYKKLKTTTNIEYFIPPMSFVAILVFIQSDPLNWPGISSDGYHSGEFYLPWWLFQKFKYLPFVDYQPARGLANYLPGFLSWLFYDNTFSGQTSHCPPS